MSRGRRRWRIRPAAPVHGRAASAFPPLIRRLLAQRGVRNEQEAARFLFLDAWPQADPLLLPGLEPAVERLAQAVTRGETVAADCGTSSVAEVAEANRLGMDVVVLDHHAIPQGLPASLALVNPKLGVEGNPHADLAAAGGASQTG